MAISQQQRTELLTLLVGMFDAAPGSDILDELANGIDAGNTIAQYAANLVESSEFTGIYSRGLTAEEFASSFIANLLGSTVSAEATAEAEAFVAGRLNAGASRDTVIIEALTALSAVAEDDATWGAAAAQLNNKVEVAEYFALNGGFTGLSLSQMQAAISGVTNDDATVTSKKAAIDAGEVDGTVTSGQTFTLTTGIDVINGTSGNDTLVADAATASAADSFNGGLGTDTFKLVGGAAADVIQTSSVEVYELVGQTAGVDVSNVSDLTTLKLDDATTAQTFVIDGGVAVEVSNMVAGEAVTITSSSTDTTADLTVTDLDKAKAGTVTVNYNGAAISTVNLTAEGTSQVTLTSTGSEKTINVDGSGDLVLVDTETALTTFDASAATGKITFDMSSATGADQTIKGGSGNDTLTVDLARNITLDAGAGDDVVVLANPTAANLSSAANTTDSIDGGAGNDTLSVTAAGAVSLAGDTAADRAKLVNFEELRTSTDLNASSFDISKFGLNALEIAAETTTGAATVSGFTSGATIEYTAAASSTVAVNVGMTGATGAGTPDDLLNIDLNSNLVNNSAFEVQLGLSGINKLQVSATDSSNSDAATSSDDGYVLTLSNDNNVSLINVTGDREVSFTSTNSTAALATVNASESTGDLILNLATNGLTQGVTVTGSAGANTITGTGFGDIISGGAKADTITGGAGDDQLTGGAGADTFVYSTDDQTTVDGSATETISDYALGVDILSFDTTGDGATTDDAAVVADSANEFSNGVATGDLKADIADEATLADALAKVTAAGYADNAVLAFEWSGNTYVIHADASAEEGNIVQLTGVTGATTITETADTFVIA